jgi:hypothetical protein
MYVVYTIPLLICYFVTLFVALFEIDIACVKKLYYLNFMNASKLGKLCMFICF